MKRLVQYFCALICFQHKLVYSARILAVTPMPSYSHHRVYKTIWLELLKRGHEITLLTTDPFNDPNLKNLTEIDWSYTYKIKYEKYNYSHFDELYNVYDARKIIEIYGKMFNEITDEELKHAKVQELIRNKSEQFDLLIVEFHLPVFVAFSNRFNCPYIGISSLDLICPQHSFVGNMLHPVAFPDYLLPFHGKLNFFQRLISTIFTFALTFSIPMKEVDKQINQYFGKGYPSISDIFRNSSMVFVNVHPALNLRPLGPATIPIGGGVHIESSKKLPKDILSFLDSATKGAILFSLGSSIKSSQLDNKIKNEIIGAFAELPYKILWKYEEDMKIEIPKNVLIAKWLPQQDILRHPNIKLFITQGGIQSFEEAVSCHVPMIGIPFTGDQRKNVKYLDHINLGISINRKDITTNVLKKLIIEVIQNPKYRENVKKLSEIILDQPMTGLEKAIWWTEYVIRHKGAKHLRSPLIDLPTYQYYLLDVFAFLALVVTLLVLFLYKITKLLCQKIKNTFCKSLKVKTS